MSFDLYIHGPETIWPRLQAMTQEAPHFQVADHSIGYHNPETGVYFHLDRCSHDDGARAALHINYNRPAFFGHECLRAIAPIAQALGLDVDNPQHGEGVVPFEADVTLTSWLDGNSWACQAMAQFGDQVTMPEADAMAMWRYLYDHKPRYEARFGESIHVPSVVVLGHDGASQPLRHVVLARPDHVVLPPFDVASVLTTAGMLTATREDIVNALKDLLVPLDEELGVFLADHDSPDAQEWGQLHDILSPEFVQPKLYSMDSFVTVAS